MGLIAGSASFTRYTTEGEVPENFLEDLPRRISRFAFRNIDETSEQERAVGWVNIMDTFDSRFGAMEYLKEPCIAMAWRVDARRVPAKALKQYCREAEERIKQEEGLEFLSKKRRQEIRDLMKADLMRRAIPRSQSYDMLWNLQTSTVIFGSTGSKLCDEFAGFFLECFGLLLKAVFPYSITSRLLEKEGVDHDLLEGLRPSLAEAR